MKLIGLSDFLLDKKKIQYLFPVFHYYFIHSNHCLNGSYHPGDGKWYGTDKFLQKFNTTKHIKNRNFIWI